MHAAMLSRGARSRIYINCIDVMKMIKRIRIIIVYFTIENFDLIIYYYKKVEIYIIAMNKTRHII